MIKKLLIIIVSLTINTFAHAQTPAFEVEDMGRLFSQKSVPVMRPMADGVRYSAMQGVIVRSYNYADGSAVDTLANVQALSRLRINDYQLSNDETKILFRYNYQPLYRRTGYAGYILFDRTTGRYISISQEDSLRTAKLSPMGDNVLYVFKNNIYVRSLSGERTTVVTSDGVVNKVINGMPDWVYEEEFAVSSMVCWSPDGQKIAYLKSNECNVREYQIPYYTRSDDPYPVMYSYKYPKAGEANSSVTLHVYDLSTGKTTYVDMGSDPEKYIPYFEWTPDGQLYAFRLDRAQQNFDILLADATGRTRVIYSEKSDKYVEVDNLGSAPLYFLSDSRRFIIRNETSAGRWHLYLYDINKGLVRAITKGDWDVTGIVRVTDNNIWFTSNEESPLRSNLYTIDLGGKSKRRITTGDGTHRIVACNSDNYFVDYFSNATTPTQVSLIDAQGKTLRTIEDNAALKARIEELELPVKEFFEISLGDNKFNAYMIKPAGFDANNQYPVFITQYSGPGSQEVVDRWGVSWEDALVQQGYIVACLDPRGTGGRGEEFKKLTYGHLGEFETADQINFAKSLSVMPFVDKTRIGIYGWSYGGFMALNCILQGASVFKMAIAVAPLTSWRFYDSVYTERYNGDPHTNVEGYDNPSPLTYAAQLEGKLLIIHGTADDNVHYQNSMVMAAALVKEDKQFDMFSYPDDNHSMYPEGRATIYRKMVDYVTANL